MPFVKTKDIVYIALFAAIMAALAVIPPITLATGVPISSQSMGPMLAGAILGARRGALSMILFLVLVAAGLPLLVGVILIVGGLTFFPSLALGPIVEHLAGAAGQTFAAGG